MRDNEPELQANDGEPDSTRSWGTNGSGPAGSDTPPNDDSTDPAAADATDAVAADATADATADDSSAFLADLARVMQAAAGAERIRTAEESERRRAAHLELIRARETSGADELRVAAEGDIKAIDSWADTEIERIQSERERRTVSRRAELSQRLDDHRLLIGREVDAVEAAIAAYRAEVEAYFVRLDAEEDPVAIAKAAGSRPTFPDLDTIGPDRAPVDLAGRATSEGAAADATGDEPPTTGDEPPSTGDAGLIGVMDTDAATGSAELSGEGVATTDQPVEATAGTTEGGGDAATAADVETPSGVEPVAGVEVGEESGQSVETTAQSNVVAPRSSAALLRAVPTARPMGSWFRRDGGERGNSETDA
jgi:hypothetical protein